MVLQERLGSKPEDFDELEGLVKKMLKEPGLNESQQSVMRKCLAYLERYKDRHWFCDPYIYSIASHVLIIFSFPGQETSWIKTVMLQCITQCADCCKGFNDGKSNLYKTFAADRHIPISDVKQVLDGIVSWEHSLIENELLRWSNKCEFPHNDALVYDEDIEKAQTLVLFCLYDPELLRRDANTNDQFYNVWKFLKSKDRLPQFECLNQGLIYLMFEGKFGNKETALDIVSHKLMLKVTKGNTPNSTFPAVVHEFTRYLYMIQHELFYNEEVCSDFWKVFAVIMSQVDLDCFIEWFNHPADIQVKSKFDKIEYFLLIGVLYNHLRASINYPLPNALKFYAMFLETYQFNTWLYSSPVTFGYVIDFIMNNKFFPLFFGQNLNVAESCLSWIRPFCDSLKNPMRTTAVSRLTSFLLSLKCFQHAKIISKQHLIIETCLDILDSSFDPDSLKRGSESLETEILAKRDIRSIIDSYSSKLVEVFSQVSEQSSPICQKLYTLIDLCFTFDLLILCSNSLSLLLNQHPKIFDSFPVLWSNINMVDFSSNQKLVKTLFKGFISACKVIKFIDKKSDKNDKELSQAFKKHNEQVEVLTNKINSIMEKLSILDSPFLLIIFEDEESLRGYWSCLFSNILSQNGLDIIYQTFEVEGRFEGLQILLKKYLRNSLNGVINSVKCLTELGAFESSPKAVRLIMDIIKVLSEPATGVLVSETYDNVKCKTELLELWSCCWEFLIMLYKKTLVWATLYHSSQLVEFTRDTLDLSHLLFDSYRIIANYVDEEGVDAKLVSQVLNLFDSILVWLRLGDMSLLNSCVELVFKGFDLAGENNIPVKKELLVLFVKYGAKAKRFNNKLTQLQRTDIIARAREIDNDLVIETLNEIMETFKEVAEPSKSTSPEVTEERENGKASMKQPKITNFGSSSKAPVIKKSPEVQTTKLDSIRNQLHQQRNPSKIASNIAPARPPGFNPKKVVVGRSLNSLKKKHDDSSDEDGDDDVDTSDLFTGYKKGRPKVTEIGFDGRPLKKIVPSQEVNKQQLAQQRMQMRLNVDMKGLYRRILKWNFNGLEYPEKNLLPQEEYKDSFPTVKDYAKTMEPLLMLECWASIQAAKDRSLDKPFDVFIGTRYSCDGFFDLYCTINKSIIADRQLTETDLIVLGVGDSSEQLPKSQLRSMLTSPNSVTCLAKINVIKSVNSEVADVTLRVASSGPMLSNLAPKTSLFGMKVMKMVTIEREYSSLKGLEYYDMCEAILHAEPTIPVSMSEDDIKGAMKTYNLNHSQAKAIIGTEKSKGFSLIQGPPGTGKTKTILGIVGYNLQQLAVGNIEPTIKGNQAPKKKEDKILICAPSNAAVDELVLRLKEGIPNSSGDFITPKVVRLGRSDAINAAVRECTLEELVDGQLAAKTVDNRLDNTLKEEHIRINAEKRRLIDLKRDQSLSGTQLEEIETRIRDISKQLHLISKKLDEDRERVQIAYRTREIDRRNVQSKILNEAQIICSTLSGSAHDFLASLYINFNKVVIDEACQCVELSAIIPLRYGCDQCIMVGDPNQLPPTVISQAAASHNYDRSLFVRMQNKNPNSVYLLDIQYRMHPEISVFPSKNFYDGKLKDGERMKDKNSRPWHQINPLAPYKFFNIVSSHHQDGLSQSLFNTTEARITLEIVQVLMDLIPQRDFKGKVGIISPYKEQIRVLKLTFVRKYGAPILNEIDFNTVDGFQGQEKDIVIMSCVRANSSGGVGFLSDTRRMNVALTRARSTLLVLGNAMSLSKNRNWHNLIKDARDRGLYQDAFPGFFANVQVSQAQSSAYSIDKTDEEGQTIDEEQADTNSETDPLISEENPKRRKVDNGTMLPVSVTEKMASNEKPSKNGGPSDDKDKGIDESQRNYNQNNNQNLNTLSDTIQPTKTGVIRPPPPAGPKKNRPNSKNKSSIFIRRR